MCEHHANTTRDPGSGTPPHAESHPVQHHEDERDTALVADDNSDADSALNVGSDELSTSSLRSSIYHYHLENGRLYHGANKSRYILPSDEDENERLDVQHHHFLLTFDGRQHFAPGAETAKRVLDAGTGTGIWAIDFADEHPEAEIIGVDLNPIQPDFVPPNCKFEIDDIEKEWTWTEPFDYIYSRMMVGSLADWPNYLEQAYKGLEPGGWIELADCLFPVQADDDSLKEEHTILQWTKSLAKASENLGRPLTEAQYHKKRLIDAGFVNVREMMFKWPTNPWAKDSKHKEVGRWTLANIDGGLEGLSMALLTRGLNWTHDEVMAYLVDVRKDLRDRSIHAYWPILVVYGQKPYSPTAAAGVDTAADAEGNE